MMTTMRTTEHSLFYLLLFPIAIRWRVVILTTMEQQCYLILGQLFMQRVADDALVCVTQSVINNGKKRDCFFFFRKILSDLFASSLHSRRGQRSSPERRRASHLERSSSNAEWIFKEFLIWANAVTIAMMGNLLLFMRWASSYGRFWKKEKIPSIFSVRFFRCY